MPDPPHLLSVGAFGEAVARHLSRSHPELILTQVVADTVPLPETWPRARIYIIAAWRPVPHICELMNQISHEWKRPFIPLIQDSRTLRLGPIVVPGCEGCWRCWSRRSAQHRSSQNRRGAILRYYSSNPEVGPKGFLQAFALMASARLSHTIYALDSSSAVPGSVWEIDTLSREIKTGKVIGVHGCPYCGLKRAETDRGFAEMRSALNYLWTGTDSVENNEGENRK